MAAATIWQLLFLDDDPDLCRQVHEFLDGEIIIPPDDCLRAETLHDFGAALNELEVRRFDLLILDVRLGPYSSMPDEKDLCVFLRPLGGRDRTRVHAP